MTPWILVLPCFACGIALAQEISPSAEAQAQEVPADAARALARYRGRSSNQEDECTSPAR